MAATSLWVRLGVNWLQARALAPCGDLDFCYRGNFVWVADIRGIQRWPVSLQLAVLVRSRCHRPL